MSPQGIRGTPPLGTPTWDFSNIYASQGRTAQSIWRFHSTEDALKHDAGALKKGEIYDRNEFYKRVKAWFKAEIDRKLYLQNLEKSQFYGHHPNVDEDTQPTSPQIAICYFPRESPDTGLSKPAAVGKGKVPTRIQPLRAAKRKVPPTTIASSIPKRPVITRKKAEAADFLYIGGDYTLDAYDWEISLIHCDSSSPRAIIAGIHPGVHEKHGSDISLLMLRLSRIIATKISQIHTDGYIQRRKVGKLRCALDTVIAGKKRKKYKLPREGSFQPAAKVLPGEDWDSRRSRPGQAGTPIPEAEMETSPTLGKWPAAPPRGGESDDDEERKPFCRPPGWEEIRARDKREKELKVNPGRALVEKLERDCTVEVSGLRFAVDLCQSGNGSEEGARFVML
ncbi:hypothetical protein QBC36DRAFT_301138 [Triangularia setosa]|uniref:Uncharacterized protein n=1 Tax=Triangularia setosa TaxID=2587417 RepID=A0AAN6W7F0_9PEZI|nr:hypothetical protein QBC36DRAFT_301138 [Podospora setosa]